MTIAIAIAMAMQRAKKMRGVSRTRVGARNVRGKFLLVFPGPEGLMKAAVAGRPGIALETRTDKNGRVIRRYVQENRRKSKSDGNISTAFDLAIPDSVFSAPVTIKFSPNLQRAFDSLWSQSFSGGKSLEDGATIVSRKDGQLSIRNIGGVHREGGRFAADLKVNDLNNYKVVGTVHTHPYDGSEGKFTGATFSGDDIANLINNNLNFLVVQSGGDQFVLLKTRDTPSKVSGAQLHDQEVAAVSQLEREYGQPFPIASRMAVRGPARQYHLAYYEGSNGVLKRIYPPAS